jgi:enoyl-CoA hydratase
MPFESQSIETTPVAAGIVRIAIHNPPLNVLTQEVRRELGDFFRDAKAQAETRCVIWGSGDRAFCAGADLKEFPLRFDTSVARKHGENAHRMILALVELDIPVIAAVRGFCMGGGLELALGCGTRIAARSAVLALPEIDRGVWPGTGGIALLSRLVGHSKAKRFLFSGQRVDAERALELGLVDEVVDNEKLEERALELAVAYAAKPGQAVRTITQLIDRDFRAAFRSHLEFELERFVQTYQTYDAREGNQAFFEKRAPIWHHASEG